MVYPKRVNLSRVLQWRELFVFSSLGTLSEICERFTFSCDYYLIYLTRIIGIVKNVSHETVTILNQTDP